MRGVNVIEISPSNSIYLWRIIEPIGGETYSGKVIMGF